MKAKIVAEAPMEGILYLIVSQRRKVIRVATVRLMQTCKTGRSQPKSPINKCMS
jgi:hypothetical protein